MHNGIIQVMAVQDRLFRDSYWSFDIRSELATAFHEFKRQFGSDFKLKEIKDWDSVGSTALRNYPFNLIQKVSKGLSMPEIVEYLVGACKGEMELPLEVSKDEKSVIIKQLKGKSLSYQMGFLEARLGSWLEECFFKDLQGKEPIDLSIGLVFALSGKISIWSHSAGCAKIGKIFTEDAYILVGNSSIRGTQPSKVILHEIGHALGANHTEDDFVMKQGSVSSYDFDPESRDIISKKLDSIV